jgi:hypothetical protein
MKRITAIVLALVMVFAFVGSASALTNREPLDITTPTASVPSITLDLQIISSIIGLPTAGSIINWASFNAEANAYFEGQVVYFNAQIGADGYYAYYTTGDGAAAAAAGYLHTTTGATAGGQIWNSIDEYGLNLLIESAGMNFSLSTMTQVVNTKTPTTPSYDVMQAMSPTAAANITRTVGSINVEVTDGDMSDLNFYKLNYLFDAVVTGMDPVVTATLVAGPGLTTFPALDEYYYVFGAPATTAANSPFKVYFSVAKIRNATAGKGNAAYCVWYENAIPTVTAADNDGGLAIVPDTNICLDFDLQDNGTLSSPDGMVLNIWDEEEEAPIASYRVGMGTNQAATSRWGFETIAGTTVLSTADIAALNLLINAIFEQFGFSYSLNGRIIDMDFIAPANFVLQDSVTVKTATATIDEGDGDDVPVTGDVASTFGFVMIAVAIIATASLAIVAKKAR